MRESTLNTISFQLPCISYSEFAKDLDLTLVYVKGRLFRVTFDHFFWSEQQLFDKLFLSLRKFIYKVSETILMKNPNSSSNNNNYNNIDV